MCIRDRLTAKKKLLPKSAVLVRKYQKPIRVAFASLITILCISFLLHSRPSVGAVTKSNGLIPNNLIPVDTKRLQKPHTDKVQKVQYPENDGVREKATFVTLARNSDLWDLVTSIRDVEDRFNRRFHYDWVFLNDKAFSEEFKRVTSALVSGTAKYGLIDSKHWSVPAGIDEELSLIHI